MTGRELIIYILQHNLEDEVVLIKEQFIPHMTEKEAAVKFNVGIATIKAWRKLGLTRTPSSHKNKEDINL